MTQKPHSEITTKVTPASSSEDLRASHAQPQSLLTKTLQRQTLWFGLSLLALGGSVGMAVLSWQQNSAANAKNLRFQELVTRVDYLDEVLTSSARLFATSGDTRWQQRYDKYLPESFKVLEQLVQISPTTFKNQPAAVNDANQKLADLETEAFKLVTTNRKQEAMDILLSPTYEKYKTILADGNSATMGSVKQQVRAEIAVTEMQLYVSLGLAGLSALLSILIVNNARLTRASLQDKLAYNLQLEGAQVNLQQTNEELEKQTDQLRQQAQKLSLLEMTSRLDNEQLQEDIGHLLDVVSELEGGNLQINAEVNDRATGLISDTLNRLIEELALVIGQVLTSAKRVAQTSANLDQTAQALSGYAIQQNQGAEQVLQLTKQVQLATQASNQQVTNTNQSLGRMAAVVETGRQDLVGMNQSIGVLQQGAEQIIQQMKTLGEFLGLADQFVQEQTETVTQTQVLALNATLVAARASEQRDPRQFASVAREFEKIAAQVSALSQQTNDSLAQLERRTANIHTAVTAIDTEVQNLGGLVQGFTAGVTSSNQSFDLVKTAVSEVLGASEALNRSNRRIVEATQTTALAMGEMAGFALKAAQLSEQSQAQAKQVEELSVGLLERVSYFRLPTATLPEELHQVQVIPTEQSTATVGFEVVDLEVPAVQTLEVQVPEVGLLEAQVPGTVKLTAVSTSEISLFEINELDLEDMTILQDPESESSAHPADISAISV